MLLVKKKNKTKNYIPSCQKTLCLLPQRLETPPSDALTRRRLLRWSKNTSLCKCPVAAGRWCSPPAPPFVFGSGALSFHLPAANQCDMKARPVVQLLPPSPLSRVTGTGGTSRHNTATLSELSRQLFPVRPKADTRAAPPAGSRVFT